MPNGASDADDVLGSWERNQALILYRLDLLDRHTQRCEQEWEKANGKLAEIERDLRDRLGVAEVDRTEIKTRARVWGAIAGTISAAVVSIAAAVIVAWLT